MENKKTIEEKIQLYSLEETEEFLENDINDLDIHEGNRALKTVVLKLIREIKGLKRI